MGMDHADLVEPSQLTPFLLEQAIIYNLLEEPHTMEPEQEENPVHSLNNLNLILVIS